jgi:hypothetical protein
MRYSPGSLVVIACAVAGEREAFAERVIEDRGAIFSMDKVRGLIAGRVSGPVLETKAAEILYAAIAKRLNEGQSVVLAADGLDAEARAPFVRMAAAMRRPRHFVLLESARDAVSDDDRPALNELRRALDAGELGSEGFQTALRVGGSAISELKRIVFRPPPADD